MIVFGQFELIYPMFLRRLLFVPVFFLVSTVSAYTIRGTLGHLNACYHPRVYLEVIKDIDGFYDANSDNLIASADVAADGTFQLSGNDLPSEKLFYRLYATTSAGVKTSILNGPNPNYILLALENASRETISCGDFCSASATYDASDLDNRLLAQLTKLRNKYITETSGGLSESKIEFLSSSYREQMSRFADTSQSIAAFYAAFLADESGPGMPALAAGLKRRFPQSGYTRQIAEKADLESLPFTVARSRRLNILLGSLLLLSVVANVFFLVRRKRVVEMNSTAEQQARELIETLSIKEREILKMVHEGLSNKEIADKHNIEVSTVKTHVSRIYQKTGIRNRKEVASIARYA